MSIAESAVDWAGLLDVLWTAGLAGIGVTAAFALTILGATRSADLRRDGHALAAGAYTLLMALAFAVVVAAVVFSVVIMRQK